MKKRNSSKSGTKRNRRKSDYVVEHPNSSELGMLDRIKPSPRIHRSDEQFMAKVNRVSSPVELHSETVSYIPQELEDSMYWNSEHQLISELPPVLTNTLAQPTDSTLEMTAIAHADELLEMNPCSNNDDSESDCRDEQEQYPVEAPLLADEIVRTEKLADFSVISSKIAPEAIQSDHISNLSINSQHLADESIRSYHLCPGAVERDAIAYGAIDRMRLALDSVGTVHIQDHAITERTIQPKSIGSHHIAEFAVISEHIEPNSITDVHLQSESVTTDALQDGIVTSEKLAYGAVESLHIQEEAVQTAHLVDAAVTADKLADDSVGSEHVRAGSIFKKHLGFTPVRVMSERSPALQFGTTSFAFEHQDQRELEINVLFTSSYEKADYTFVCTSNLYGTCAVIREQYDDGVIVRVVRELNSLDDSTAPVPVSGALSWIAVG